MIASLEIGTIAKWRMKCVNGYDDNSSAYCEVVQSFVILGRNTRMMNVEEFDNWLVY